jgi:hypothetical protein
MHLKEIPLCGMCAGLEKVFRKVSGFFFTWPVLSKMTFSVLHMGILEDAQSCADLPGVGKERPSLHNKSHRKVLIP